MNGVCGSSEKRVNASRGFTGNVAMQITVELWIRVCQMEEESLGREHRGEWWQVMMKSAFHNQQEFVSPMLKVKVSTKPTSLQCPPSLRSSVTPFLFKGVCGSPSRHTFPYSLWCLLLPKRTLGSLFQHLLAIEHLIHPPQTPRKIQKVGSGVHLGLWSLAQGTNNTPEMLEVQEMQ